MATRIYLPSSGAAPVTPSTWNHANQAASTYTCGGVLTKGSTAMTSRTTASGTTNPYTRAVMRCVIGPLAAVEISGTVKAVMRCSEANAGANATLSIAAKIIKPDGTDRSVLLAETASDKAGGSEEFSTSLYGRLAYNASEAQPITLTAQTPTAGDYLVIELGFRSASGTSYNVVMRHGDNSASDMVYEVGTSTNDYAPWAELSQTLTWYDAKGVADSGSGADAVGVKVKAGLSDAGAGSEALAVLRKIALLDAGAGSELLGLLGKVAISDAGVGAEAISALLHIALADAGAGSDAATTKGRVIITDAGAGADLIASIKAKLAIADFGAVAKAGQDIRFTGPDGATLLDYERVGFDAADGKAKGAFMVKCSPQQAGGDIYIYYGNAAAADGESRAAVWAPDSRAVYHLNDPSTPVHDSTSNANNGTKKAASEPQEVDAKIGKGQRFDGVDDEITVADAASLDLGIEDWSLGAWVKVGTLQDGTILAKGKNGGYRVQITPEGKVWVRISGDDRMASPTRAIPYGDFIYICDTCNHRLVKRRADNFEYVTKFGSQGSGNDQFYTPRGIATDGTYLYVVDASNNRIKKHLCSDLSYVSKFGSYGVGDNNFKGPGDIATDGTYLYIADTSNNRIKKHLCSDLSYVAKIGSTGSGDNEFSGAYGIATDNTYLYIADSFNNRIKKHLCSDLSFVAKIGSAGVGNDQFQAPYGIATDGTHIFVSEYSNSRIQKRLCSDLSFVAKIGSLGYGNDQFQSPWGIATDGTSLYVTDYAYSRIKKHKCSDLSYVSKLAAGAGLGDDQFFAPAGGISDGTYIYIAEQYNNRIVKRRCSDLSFVSKIGSYGTGNDNFYQPRGIATDGTYLYVADSANHRIKKHLCSDLSYVSKIGSYGVGDDYFANPYCIATDGTYVYVADTYNDRIKKHKCADLSYVAKIGSTGSGDNEFNRPWGITTDDTYVYVADQMNNRIVKRLCSDLSYVAKIGSYGGGDDQFIYPRGIDTDGTYIYIADSNGNRIQKRKCLDLTYVAKNGDFGSGDNNVNYPLGIATDGTYVYVADSSNHRVVKRLCSDLSYVDDLSSNHLTAYSAALPVGSFVYVKVRVTHSSPDATIDIFVDGVLSGTSTNPQPVLMDNATAVKIGSRFAGDLDELRLAAVDRSAAWLKFEHHNMAEADNELTWGAKETQAGPPPPIPWGLPEWTERKTITIQTDNLDADLADFPLLAVLNEDVDIGAACQTGGDAVDAELVFEIPIADAGLGTEAVFVDPQGRPALAFIFDAFPRGRILVLRQRDRIVDVPPRDRIQDQNRRK